MARGRYPAAMSREDTLIRIGRGVPGAGGRPPKSAAYWVTVTAVIAVVIAVAALAVAMYRPKDKPDPAVMAAQMAAQTQCANLAKAYQTWTGHKAELDVLLDVDAFAQGVYLGRLREDADTFASATDGYTDQPTQQLHLAVLDYRLDVGLLALANSGGLAIGSDDHRKTLDAWAGVETSYRLFTSATC